MKVYVKKGDYPSPIVYLAIMAMFGILPVFCFYQVSLRLNEGQDFFEFISSNGIVILFSIVFLAFDLYFLYHLMSPPKKFKAWLVDKKAELYKGQEITAMIFSTKRDDIDRQQDPVTLAVPGQVVRVKFYSGGAPGYYPCYTTEPCALQIGQEYNIGVKKFNWKIKTVDDLQGDHTPVQKTPEVTFFPVILALVSIFGVGALFLATKIVHDLLNHINNLSNNLIALAVCLVFGVGICMIPYLADKSRTAEKNSGRKQEIRLRRIAAMTPLPRHQKVPNLIAKKAWINVAWSAVSVLFLGLFAWLFLWFFARDQISEAVFNVIFYSCLLMFAVFVVFGLFFALLAIVLTSDKRLIKKHNLNVLPHHDIDRIDRFHIFRSSPGFTVAKFFIADDSNNLLYKVQPYGFLRRKYIISDQNNYLIGEMIDRFFAMTSNYTIRILDNAPFLMRRKFRLSHDYDLTGISYSVTGDMFGIKHSICDKDGNELALISTKQNKRKWYKLGNACLEIKPGFSSSQAIVSIALCVTIDSYNSVGRVGGVSKRHLE